MYEKRITDLEVFDMIKKLDDVDINNENINKEFMQNMLALMVDTRILVRKVYKNMYKVKQPRVYKTPTDNKDDIIVGA